MSLDYIHVARPPHVASLERKHTRLRIQKERTQRNIPWHLAAGITVFLVSCAVGFLILLLRAQWDGLSQYSFVVFTGEKESPSVPVTVVTVRGKEKTATILPLPDTVQIETLRGYGQYKVSSLIGLAELEHLPPSFVFQTLAFQLGVDMRASLRTYQNINQLNRESLIQTLQSSLLFQAPSTLSYIDRVRLLWFFTSVRKDQVSVIDPLSSGLVRPSEQGGEEQLYTFEITKLDTFVSSVLADPAMRKEQLSVAVVNTTGEPRLATRIARALSGMGVDVVNITQIAQVLDQSRIDVEQDKQTKSGAVQSIAHTMQINKKHIGVSAQHAVEYRADIVVFVGKDVAELF